MNPTNPTLRQRLGALIRACVPLNRRTFDLVRFEMGCFGERLMNLFSPRYHVRLSRLARRTELSLNVGCGGHTPTDWVNIDARGSHRGLSFTHDIRRRVPLPDGCARRIFAEHVVEHLDYPEEALRTLKDFNRLLQPGGRVRIVVPDARRFLEAYLAEDWQKWGALGWRREAWPVDIFTPMHAVNHVFHQRGEHYFGYDYATLCQLLESTGFYDVSRSGFGNSPDPALAIDSSVHAPYSLYVEAVKAMTPEEK